MIRRPKRNPLNKNISRNGFGRLPYGIQKETGIQRGIETIWDVAFLNGYGR